MSVDTIDYEPDWIGRLRSRIYEQFKGLPIVDLWAVIIGTQAQDLEDAGQSLRTLMSIDDSEGVQLQRLANLVGQSIAGLDDATARLYIRARIRTNKSSGTPGDLYAIVRALLGLTAPTMVIHESSPESLEFIVSTPITDAQALAAVSFLRDGKDAGARLIFEWQGYIDAQMFTCEPVVAFLSADTASGAHSIVVGSTAGFPPSGTLLLDAGPPDYRETVDYVSRTATTFVLDGGTPTTKDHKARCAVSLSGSAGAGFGDGHFAGALQA